MEEGQAVIRRVQVDENNLHQINFKTTALPLVVAGGPAGLHLDKEDLLILHELLTRPVLGLAGGQSKSAADVSDSLRLLATWALRGAEALAAEGV